MIRTIATVSVVAAGLAGGGLAVKAQLMVAGPNDLAAAAPAEIVARAVRAPLPAGADDDRAQYNAGVAFLTGRGVARNQTEASKWFERYAAQGDADRQFSIGRVYMGYVTQTGNARLPDYGEAAAWFRRAAAQGHYRAQRELGDIYDYGLGMTADPDEATSWYRRAAETAGGKDDYLLALRAMLGHDGAPDYAEAAAGFLRVAERRNPAVTFSLGVLYEYGLGVTRNHVEAAKWYRFAAGPHAAPANPLVSGRRNADLRGAEAQYRLGYFYERGLGVPRDRDEALAWYRRAAERNDARAQYALGRMHEHGDGVTQDYAEAVKWYRAAAIQGSAMAQTRLGRLYRSGTGVAADGAHAGMWLRLAAGHRWAPDPAGREGQWTGTAEQAIAEVQFIAAVDRLGPENYRDALQWLRTLAGRGHVKAQYVLAQVLDNGPTASGQGAVRNGAEAATWYARAADQGHAAARLALAGKYMAGWDVPRNLAEAAKLTRLAAEQGVTVSPQPESDNRRDWLRRAEGNALAQ